MPRVHRRYAFAAIVGLLLALTTIPGHSQIATAATKPLFLYVNNNNEDPGLKPNSVSGYSVNADGSLTEIDGSPWSTGGTGDEGGTPRIAVDQARGRVYVANGFEGTIAGFAADPATGALTALPGSPYETGLAGGADTFQTLAVGPDGSWLVYVQSDIAGQTGVVVMPIKEDGSLGTQVESTFDKAGFAADVSPDGRLLALAQPYPLDANGIDVYAIDAIGHLTLASTLSNTLTVPYKPSTCADGPDECTKTMPSDLQFTRDGSQLVAALPGLDRTQGYVASYAVNDATLTLEHSFAVKDVFSVALSHDDSEIFGVETPCDLSKCDPTVVRVLSLDSDGALLEVAGSPYAAPIDDTFTSLSPDIDGNLIYSVGHGGTIFGYAAAAEGTLSALSSTTDDTDHTSVDTIPAVALYDPAAVTSAQLPVAQPTAAEGAMQTFSASVAAATGDATGDVEFRQGTRSLGSAPVSSEGDASLATVGLAPGSEPVEAWYSGDDVHSPHLVRATQNVAGPSVGAFASVARTDLAVFRPSNGDWYVDGLPGSTHWGTIGDVPVAADFVGNAKADLAVFRPSNGTWYVRGLPSVHWGTAGDIPVAADFTGDGKADLALFRPSNGTWYVRGLPSVRWGTVGDVPLAADFTGDGKADFAVFRPSNGTWYVRGKPAVQWGTAGDIPSAADFNGDAKADLAVFRPSTGTWYVQGRPSVPWGTAGDIPAAADFTGDGAADLAVFRPSTGAWYVQHTPTIHWGTIGDVPS